MIFILPPKITCSGLVDLKDNIFKHHHIKIQRRFSPFNKLATNIGNFDLKSQLNKMYDNIQPLWGRKNNPQSFGSIISEISATQPGSQSMTSYTVPGSGITHITDHESPIPAASVSDTSSASKDTSKQDTGISRSGVEKLYLTSDESDDELNLRTLSSFNSNRDRDRDWRDRDREYSRDKYRDRDYRRDRSRRNRYRDRDRDQDPYGPYGPVSYGIQVGESLKSHDKRTSSSSRSQSAQPYPYPPYPYPPFLPFPPGVSPLTNPIPFPPGYPPPYLNQIPGGAASQLHPMFAMLPSVSTTESPSDPSVATDSPSKTRKKKDRSRTGAETIIEEDGTITIAGIKPQKIVDTVADVVTRTGLHKVIGKALNSVVSQISTVGTRFAGHVVHELGENVQVSVSNDDTTTQKPLPLVDTILKLGDAKISFKPTKQGISISFGKNKAPSST